MILDSASFNVMLQSVLPPVEYGCKVDVEMACGPHECIMAGDTFMGKWHMSTTNATERGCQFELSKCGMLKATFSPVSNKLLYMEQTFDVMSFMQQLRQASGKSEFFVSALKLLFKPEHLFYQLKFLCSHI